MPFTLSHPAIILPFAYVPRRFISMTGLIVGSMMPDFESLVWMKADKAFSHTWWGILWFCLPVGLILCFLYHNLVRDLFISHMPKPLQLKLIRFQNYPWNEKFASNWFIILLSLALGAASHLFWDGFSHFNSFFSDSVPGVNQNVQIGDQDLELPFLIQYINSIVGLLIIAFALWRLPKARGVRIRIVIGKFWVYSFGIAFVIYVIRMAFLEVYKVDDAIITAISSFCIGLLVTCILFKSGKVKDAWSK
jgi:hypothetical protein